MPQDKLVATVHLYRTADGTYLAVGRPEDRDQAEIRGDGPNAAIALQQAGHDYDCAPSSDPETVPM